MARQGFKYENDTPYIYQETPGNESSALGIDSASGSVYKIKVQSTSGADVSGTAQVIIDPAANGDISLSPNGSGSVNVSTAVNLPHADNGTSQGYVTFNDIRWAHNYGDLNTFVGELAGNSTLTPASALGNTACGAGSGASLSTGALNCLIGQDSGNLITSGSNNTALGQGSLGSTNASNTTALGFNALAAYDPGAGSSLSIAVGFDCLQTTVLGSGFVAIGSECGQNILSVTNCTLIGTQCADISASIGDGCICIGYQCARNSTMGPNNIIIGNLGGTAYVAVEADNILINNIGTVGDANVIRIGTQGAGASQQNTCFVAGITGVDVGSVADVVSIDTGTGQLGTTAITAGTNISVTPGAGTITIASGSESLFFATTNTENAITGNGTEGWIGAVAATTVVTNVGSDYFAGDGAGNGARYTAPATGNYFFTMALYFNSQALGGTAHETYFQVNGATNYFATAFPTNISVVGFNGPNGYIAATGSIMLSLTIGDTVDFKMLSNGGTQTDGSAAGGWINGYRVS